MSPSESELRSFLRDGEGEPIDPGAVIAHARAARHNRRVRLVSVAAAVVVVGAVSAGTAVLAGGNSGTPSANRHSHPGAAALATPTTTRPAPGHATSPANPTGHAPCPVVPLHLMLPGGGGTGQFGADGPLYDGAVSSMQVCGYAAASVGAQARYSNVTVISGAAAEEIATSLNAASTKQAMRNCPLLPIRELVIYAASRSGATIKPVVVDYTCGTTATNGTATRYDWTPPRDVAATLNSLMVANPALPNLTGGSSFRPSGSPVR
ncbi:MAG: hypothetical protein ACRDWT_03330 [Jatrophihabitantaceae bacterium]